MLRVPKALVTGSKGEAPAPAVPPFLLRMGFTCGRAGAEACVSPPLCYAWIYPDLRVGHRSKAGRWGAAHHDADHAYRAGRRRGPRTGD